MTPPLEILLLVAGGGLALILHLPLLLHPRRPAPEGEELPWFSAWSRLLHTGSSLGFLGLAASGFGPILLHGTGPKGWWLVAHLASSGLFLAALAGLALAWAWEARLTGRDREWLRRGGPVRPGGLPASRLDPLAKAFFWSQTLLGTAAGLTMLLGMLPLFEPEGLRVLLTIHRMSGLLLVLAVFGHAIRALAKGSAGPILLRGRVDAAWARHYHPLWTPPAGGKR